MWRIQDISQQKEQYSPMIASTEENNCMERVLEKTVDKRFVYWGRSSKIWRDQETFSKCLRRRLRVNLHGNGFDVATSINGFRRAADRSRAQSLLIGKKSFIHYERMEWMKFLPVSTSQRCEKPSNDTREINMFDTGVLNGDKVLCNRREWSNHHVFSIKKERRLRIKKKV